MTSLYRKYQKDVSQVILCVPEKIGELFFKFTLSDKNDVRN